MSNFLKRGLFSFWEVLKVAAIALLIVLPIRYFLFQPFLVWGRSMMPNFSDGDYLLVNELSYRFISPKRGDVIVFRYPQNPSSRYIKRIIGLPGETVEIRDGEIIIYQSGGMSFSLDESGYLPKNTSTSPKIWPLISHTLKQNEYFVLGDNRDASSDSRVWGVLPRENIIGHVFFRAWPLSVLARIEEPEY